MQNLTKILTNDGKRHPSTADEAELHHFYKQSLPEKPLWDGKPIEHRATANPDAVNTGDTAPASWEGPHLQADSARQSQYNALQAQQPSNNAQETARSTEPVTAQQTAISSTEAASKTSRADQQAELRAKLEAIKRKRAALTAEKAAKAKAAADAAAVASQQHCASHDNCHDVAPKQSNSSTLPGAAHTHHDVAPIQFDTSNSTSAEHCHCDSLPASAAASLSDNSNDSDAATRSLPGMADSCQRQESHASNTMKSCSWEHQPANTAHPPQAIQHSDQRTAASNQQSQPPASNQHVDQSRVERAACRANNAGIAPSPRQAAFDAVFSNTPDILKDPLPRDGSYSSYTLRAQPTTPLTQPQDQHMQSPHPLQQERMTRTMTATDLYGSPAPSFCQMPQQPGTPMEIDSGCPNPSYFCFVPGPFGHTPKPAFGRASQGFNHQPDNCCFAATEGDAQQAVPQLQNTSDQDMMDIDHNDWLNLSSCRLGS